MIINLIKKAIKKWHHLDKDLNFQLSKKNLSNNQKCHKNQNPNLSHSHSLRYKIFS